MSPIGISRRDFLKGVVAVAVSAAMVGVLQGWKEKVPAPTTPPQTTLPVSSASPVVSGYTPGTYTAVSDGIGKVTVTATFDTDKITNIELDVSGETEAIGGKAKEELVRQMLAAQGGEIDGVSGATITVDAAQSALQKCIDQAKDAAENP